jgi:hypothetical protein
LERLRTWTGGASPAALVVACAIPFVFLHPHYQPDLAVGQVDATLSDFAILAAVLAAVATGLRDGFEPLRTGRVVWLSIASFLVLILASLSWARAGDPTYALGNHAVSALKFVEWALLAPAAALVLRRREDRRAVYWSLALWTVVLTFIAVLQFFGALPQFRGHHPFDREPSYLGEHGFAAFAGASLSLAFAAILLGVRRRLSIVGGIAGGLGVAVAAAVDAIGGMWVTVIAAIVVSRRREWRRIAAVLAVSALVTVGSITLRGHAVAAFIRFLGIRPSTSATSENVQTWGQRVLLGYIGVEIWLHHPVAGVGWQESMLPHSFEPVLPAARKHFAKKQPPIAFPSPQREYGVQNGIVQTLADLGIVGLLLLVAIVWSVLRLAASVAARGPPELLFELIVALGLLLFGFAVFTGTGLLAGESAIAELWLGVALIVSLNHSLTTTS